METSHNESRLIAVVVAANGTESEEIEVGDGELEAVYMPAGFVGTALGFKGAPRSGGTFGTVKTNAGAALAAVVGAGAWTVLSDKKPAGVPFVKLIVDSQTSGAKSILVSIKGG